jgi:hypothetical protein
MLRSLILVTLFGSVMPVAHAQWSFQPGLGQATACPQQNGIAPNLFSPEDRVARLKSARAKAETREHSFDKRITALKEKINADRVGVRNRFSNQAGNYVIEHIERRNGPGGDYSYCGDAAPSPRRRLPTGPKTTVQVAPRWTDACVMPAGIPCAQDVSQGGDIAQSFSPFCFRGQDLFPQYAGEEGAVNSKICSDNIPYIHRPGTYNGDAIDKCRDSLEHLEEDIAKLASLKVQQKKAHVAFEARDSDLERYEDQDADSVAEGEVYCAQCAQQRQAQLTITMFAALRNTQNVAPPQIIPINSPLARTGFVPGYMGQQNGFYGGLPADFGQGGFGCNGLQNSLQNPYAFAPPIIPLNGNGRWPSAMNGGQFARYPGPHPAVVPLGGGLNHPSVVQLGQMANSMGYMNSGQYGGVSGLGGYGGAPVIQIGGGGLSSNPLLGGPNLGNYQFGNNYAPVYAPSYGGVGAPGARPLAPAVQQPAAF